jgi:hypothetical protein
MNPMTFEVILAVSAALVSVGGAAWASMERVHAHRLYEAAEADLDQAVANRARRRG